MRTGLGALLIMLLGAACANPGNTESNQPAKVEVGVHRDEPGGLEMERSSGGRAESEPNPSGAIEIEFLSTGFFRTLESCMRTCRGERVSCRGSRLDPDAFWCVPMCDKDSDCPDGSRCHCLNDGCTALRYSGILPAPKHTDYWENICRSNVLENALFAPGGMGTGLPRPKEATGGAGAGR